MKSVICAQVNEFTSVSFQTCREPNSQGGTRSIKYGVESQSKATAFNKISRGIMNSFLPRPSRVGTR